MSKPGPFLPTREYGTGLYGGGLTRRQATLAVAGLAGTLYATTAGAGSQGRIMMLALDDVQEIIVRYRGRQVAISPAMIVDALSGKGEAHD